MKKIILIIALVALISSCKEEQITKEHNIDIVCDTCFTKTRNVSFNYSVNSDNKINVFYDVWFDGTIIYDDCITCNPDSVSITKAYIESIAGGKINTYSKIK